MYRITQELVDEISYFINDWLRLMGFGREYARLANLVMKLSRLGVKFDSKYYYIHQVVRNWREK